MARVRTKERRQIILETAEQEFLERGFASTTMARIAARLGGSKATLYGYFSSKEDLFVAVILNHLQDNMLSSMEALDERGSLDEVLCRFGEAYLTAILKPHAIARRRLIIDAARWSSVGRSVYERGPRRAWSRLAEFLKGEMKKGALRKGDPEDQALYLRGLLESRHLLKFLEGIELERPTQETIKQFTRETVEVFLRAFGATLKSDAKAK